MKWLISSARQRQLSYVTKRFRFNPNYLPSRSRTEYIPLSRINLERRIRECQGLSTDLSEDELDLASRNIDRAIRRRSLLTVQDIKCTFSYIQEPKASNEIFDAKEKVEHLTHLVKGLMKKAKFTELTSLEKWESLGKRNRRPKLRESPLSDILLYAFWEYLSPRMKVNARVERFRDVRFWIRGSTIVPGETEPKREMIRRFFKSVEKEEHLQHRQVVMLLHYRTHEVELKGYRDVFRHALDELVTGGVAKLKGLDFFLLSSALFFGGIAFFVQKILHIGVYRHVNFTWQNTLIIAVAVTAFSGYFNLSSKRHIYYRRLAERNHKHLIASDEALLTYIISEAEDEVAKDVLLTLVGILNRTPRQKDGLTVFGIEANANEWLRSALNVSANFKTSNEALEILEQARLIVRSKHFFNYSHNADSSTPATSSSLFPVVVHELVSS